MKIQTRLVSLSLSLSLVGLLPAAGCQVGTLDSVDPGDPNNPNNPNNPVEPLPPDYALQVASSPTAELTLGNTAEFRLLLTSERFAGPVQLTATGVPDSWEVGFDPSDNVTLTEDGEVTVTMSVVVPTDAEAVAADIGVQADASLGPRDGLVSVAVDNLLLIEIPAGANNGAHAFPPAVTARIGATIQFVNNDTVGHRIHAGNEGDGFPHQPDAMNPGDSYIVTPTATRNYNFYCHTHDNRQVTGEGTLTLVDAPAPQ